MGATPIDDVPLAQRIVDAVEAAMMVTVAGDEEICPCPSKIARIARQWVPDVALEKLEAAALRHLYGVTLVAGLSADEAWLAIFDDDETVRKVDAHLRAQAELAMQKDR